MDKSYKFNKEMYKTVGKNIKKYRILKNLTLEELSSFAKINAEFLEKFENIEDNLTISIYDLYKISVILEVNISEFFKE